MTKLVCISDTHSLHGNLEVPDGDVFICAGDFTNVGDPEAVKRFAEWMGDFDHPHKIVVAGNHECGPMNGRTDLMEKFFNPCGITVLHEKTIEINGLRFWGEPRTPEFRNWGWMYKPGLEAEEIWSKMPEATDVLVCHGPPHGHCDDVRQRGFSCAPPSFLKKIRTGCQTQFRRIEQVKPKLVICGHIHEAERFSLTDFGTKIYNVSCYDHHNGTIRQPTVIDI